MQRSVFRIAKMDCSAEEQLIRMKLQGLELIKDLSFDLQKRELLVFHNGDPALLVSGLNELALDSRLISTEEISDALENPQREEYRLLWLVLAINFFLFTVEMAAGIYSHSMGLVADSLDMLADAMVYGLSLLAIGGAVTFKKRIARISGYLQFTLAILGLAEVLRRFAGWEEMPSFEAMILVSLLALAGNVASLIILQRSSSREAHMQASLIFTSNDVIVNIGVIVAGGLVYFTGSGYPDLVVGMIVFVVVIRGALRILKIAK